MGVRGGWREGASVQTDCSFTVWGRSLTNGSQLLSSASTCSTNNPNKPQGRFEGLHEFQPKQRLTHICRLSFLLQRVKYKDVIKIYSQPRLPVLEVAFTCRHSSSSLLHTQPALSMPPPLAGSSPSLPLSCQPFLSPPTPPPSPPPSNYFISSSCSQGIPTPLPPLINANVKERHKGLKLIKPHIPRIPPDFPLF